MTRKTWWSEDFHAGEEAIEVVCDEVFEGNVANVVEIFPCIHPNQAWHHLGNFEARKLFFTRLGVLYPDREVEREP